MKLVITINLDNAEYADDEGNEALADTLEWLEGQLVNAPKLSVGEEIPLHDINGNRVGEAKVLE